MLKKLFMLGMIFLMSTSLFAQTPIEAPGGGMTINPTLSAQQMLVNIATQLPNLMRLVTAIAYVLGMVFIIRGIIKLKHAGESRTMMSHEHHLTIPIIHLVVGGLLIYLPTAVQVGLSTFWTDPNPYGYEIPGDAYGDFLRVVFLIVQFIGTIAFIRGLVILSHVGGQGGHQGALSKGLLHIIGGIFCINIYQFIQVIFLTLGLGQMA